jgi:hypothetical protein
MLIKLYYLTVIFFILTFVFRIAKVERSELAAGIAAVIANGAALFLIFSQAGHFPLFNIFESFLFVTFMLGILGASLRGVKGYSEKIRLWVWLYILILFGVTLFYPKETAAANYNYDFICVILFYAFRYISLALMLYSSAYFIEFIIQRERDERTSLLSHQGRNFLLLSTVMFLMSEYIGIIWCQRGWGDFWMWSQTFIQSSFIVLYLMLSLHVPGKGKFSEDIRSVISGLTGFVVLTLTIIRSFLG